MKKIIMLTIAALALFSGVFNHLNHREFNALIPVISLKDYHHPDKKKDFVEKLGAAFRDHGFVAVVDADIDSMILMNAHKGAKEFFAKDLEYKRAIQSTTNNGERGYVTDETPKWQPLHIVDFKEILHIGRELTKEQLLRLNYVENIWPKDSNLKESMMPLFDELERVMLPIAAAASEYLGETAELFPEMMRKGEHLLRALHYLREPGETRNWAAEHTDMNFLTLIPGGASEGLQVKLKDGRWVDVLVPEDAVIVNVGDSLENLTNGLYRSGVHRVVAKPNAAPERWSIVYHGHARHDLEMGPLSSAIELSGGVQKYPNAKGSELLKPLIATKSTAKRSRWILDFLAFFEGHVETCPIKKI